MFSVSFACLFVSTITTEWILTNLVEKMGHGQRKSLINLGTEPDKVAGGKFLTSF